MAQQQKQKRMVEEPQETEEIQHGPFPIEQLQVCGPFCPHLLENPIHVLLL